MHRSTGDYTSPPGLIYRPETSRGLIDPLADWQMTPFEVLSPDHADPPSEQDSLAFTQNDQDFMLQVHPSLSPPVNVADLSVAEDINFMFPVSPNPGSSRRGEKAELAKEMQSVQPLVTESIRATAQLTAGEPDVKVGNIVLPSSPGQGRTVTNGHSDAQVDVLEFVPPPPTTVIPTPSPPTGDHISVLAPGVAGSAEISGLELPVLTNKKTVPGQKCKVITSGEAEGQDRPYECTECGLRFKKRCNAVNHLQIVHEKLRPYKCSHCERAFGKKSNKNKHEKLHTNSSQKLSPRATPNKQRKSKIAKQISKPTATPKLSPQSLGQVAQHFPPKFSNEAQSPVNVLQNTSN